jgi:2-C-methyl-D-erythritol 4-phosphate cytidylyltransferase
MIEWSLDALRASKVVSAIVVAAPPGLEHGLGGEEVAGGLGGPGITVVDGGAQRAESVANALAAVETELVAIHDAARPLLTPELVEELVAALDADPEAAGVIAAAPVTDTVKVSASSSDSSSRDFGLQDNPKSRLEVERTLDRARLWSAQTPQVFRTEALRAALAVDDTVRDAATDEAMLIEAAGGKVVLHPSPPENFKVTTALDLRVAELVLKGRSR